MGKQRKGNRSPLLPRARAAWLLSIVPAALAKKDFQGRKYLTLPSGGGRGRPWPASHGWQPWFGASHERRAASHEPQAGPEIPIPGRRPPSAILAVSSPRSLPASGGSLSRSVAQSLFFYIFPPLARKLCTTAYGHESMLQTIKFESKSIKKATFSVKKASKRRAFRHAHLNILRGHPLCR